MLYHINQSILPSTFCDEVIKEGEEKNISILEYNMFLYYNIYYLLNLLYLDYLYYYIEIFMINKVNGKVNIYKESKN